MMFSEGAQVLVCIHGSEFTGRVKRFIDQVYWIVCDYCGETHLALEEEMEVLSEDSKNRVQDHLPR